MSSLRGRLLLWLLGCVALAAAAAGGFIYRNALEQANAFFDEQLRQTALLLRDQPFEFSLGPPAPARDPSYDFVIQVWRLDGVRIYLSRPHTVLPGLTAPGLSTVETSAGRWRVAAVRAPTRVIQVAQPMQVREAQAARLAWRALQPFLWFVPLLGLLIWVGVGRALGPLQHLAAALQSRRAGVLDPLPGSGLPDEIRPLVDALNDLLARLAAAMERERAFLADAAHELRTPLTALRLQLDSVTAARTDRDRSEAASQLSVGVQRAIRLVQQLLSMARQEPLRARQDETVELAELAREVVGELVPLADARGVDLGIARAEPARVAGEREGLRTLLGNLVDNAVRYTPAGGRVDVSIEAQQRGAARRAVLSVVDSGPGIPAEERERVFDRFHRVPGTEQPGSGLGLAIVRSIAEAHGATVELAQGPGGRGLAATVTLPARP